MKNFKDLEIRTNRAKLLECLYGHLSEDAANIAEEEFNKGILTDKLDKFVREVKFSTQEELYASMLKELSNICTNIQEFTYMVFMVGLLCGQQEGKAINPLNELIKILKDQSE